MDDRNKLGQATEAWVSDKLRKHGIPHIRLFLGGPDIVTDTAKIEVKGVSRNQDGYYRATLVSDNQDVHKSDLLIVVCWMGKQAVLYAIETRHIHTKRIALKPGNNGQWESYRTDLRGIIRLLDSM